ncbi:PTS system D-mannose-specific IIA component, Man family /PTS system D-mannose-specific IIB component, Man family [Rosenbergiella nectarea]|uniref:PTS system mannose-specific EIIAB component n=1 Tax=Rosenbergiella nectarea TaxID=988801 RepID=A0A1H9FKL8_9GAMM|nr:PTS mannose transporter subunit IIAB [Rosenbergiella nectarea]SEQ38452.1 PTS system D-mannose-specific IIA component, Man family /PTS system D-mannose-specific IIB component, Man family [Rosenbergiella nectarea]
MTIAIIIATHGQAAEQLLKTTEMLLGEQINVGSVDFIPGENTETLINKYHDLLSRLSTTQGVLFLTDTWGGSPFNAATRLASEHSDYKVIAGVNIPMLIESFMARDDDPSLDQLIEMALEAGREGVKAYQYQLSPAVKPPSVNHAPGAPSTSTSQQGVMQFGLVRIDDRLIHGQVATRWTKETRVTRIIVVSDAVAADDVRKTLLKQVAPPGVTAHVVDVAKMLRVYANPKYAGERVMLLFTNPTDVLRVVEGGVKIDSVNIGGIAYRQGKTMVTNAVSVDQQDIDAFKRLAAKGIELEVRKVSSDNRVGMIDLLNKLSA